MSWLRRLSVHSKLVLLSLVVSGIALTVAAAVGYVSGRESLTDRVYAQLTSLREGKANEVRLYLQTVQADVQAMALDLTVLDATRAFADAADDLAARPLPAGADSLLEAFYQEQFVPRLVTDGRPVLGAYLPESPAARALQIAFLVRNPNPAGEREALVDPGDGTAYAAAHARYHPSLRAVTERLGYYDLFLIDPDGRIVYTTEKEVDFGTSLLDGPYDTSNLAAAFAEARQSRGTEAVAVADYAFYAPSYGEPAAFLAAPLSDGTEFVGVLAVQLPTDRLNAIMTNGGRWTEGGLGETGEVLLVGDDGRLRSASRPFLEDPEAYLGRLRDAGASNRDVRRIERQGSPILLQDLDSDAVDRALAGESGVAIVGSDYLGVPALSAYAPLSVVGLDWAVVAEIGADEAFAPVRQFQRRVLISAVVLSVLITLLAAALAAWFLRPVRRLTAAARQLSAGDYDADLDTGTGDEFGEMGEAFGDVVRTLRGQVERAVHEREVTETLLLRFLPDSLTQRLRETAREGGEWTMAEEVPSVTVVHVSLIGYEGLLQALPPEEMVGALDALVRGFDDARTRFGVEKIRTAGDAYLAACGLSTPHLDHARRALDFAVEARAIVRRFAAESGGALRVRFGLASGPVVAGIIGEDKLTFDLWGPAPSQADALRAAAPPDAIVVSQATYERLRDAYPFEPAGDGAWRLALPESAAPPPVARTEADAAPHAAENGTELAEASPADLSDPAPEPTWL